MGTNVEQGVIDTTRSRNQRHLEAFKRDVVEQSDLPDAPVARLAHSHVIDANQIFAWQKLFWDAELPSA